MQDKTVYKPEPPKDGIVLDDGPVAPITDKEIEEAHNGKDESGR